MLATVRRIGKLDEVLARLQRHGSESVCTDAKRRCDKQAQSQVPPLEPESMVASVSSLSGQYYAGARRDGKLPGRRGEKEAELFGA